MMRPHRREQVQVLLSIVTLFCACLLVALMVAALMPPSPSVMTVIDATTTTATAALDEYSLEYSFEPFHFLATPPQAVEDIVSPPPHAVEEVTLLRGASSISKGRRRRRLDEVLLNVPPTSVPSPSPSAFPTIVVDEILPIPSNSNNDSSSGGLTTIPTSVPAIIVGAATLVIIAALFFLSRDLMERSRGHTDTATGGGGVMDVVEKEDDGDDIEGDTSAGSDNSFWITTTSNGSPMLPPMQQSPTQQQFNSSDDDDEEDDVDMSTLTGNSGCSSMQMTSPWSFGLDEVDKKVANDEDSSSQTTELSECHLVDQDTAFVSLLSTDNNNNTNEEDDNVVLMTPKAKSSTGNRRMSINRNPTDEESSLTGGTLGSSPLQQVIGGVCIQEYGGTPRSIQEYGTPRSTLDSPRPSFDYISEEEEEEEGGEEGNDQEERDGESEGSGDAADTRQGIESFVRNIVFIPSNSSLSYKIGLEFEECPEDEREMMYYSSIMAVHTDSPLKGRIFVGDTILSVNNIDVAKMTNVELLNMLESSSGGEAIALTVHSIYSDGNDADDEGSDTIVDLDQVEGEMEV